MPLLVRWPGTIKAGTTYNNIISQEDWMPTLLAAAGVPDVVEKLESKDGYKANGKTWRVHPDGYNFLPFFKGEVTESPRKEIYYFSQGGELNALRVQNWKIHFATIKGNIADGVRQVPGWPLIINLKADPYERMWEEGSLGYWRWYADNLWTFVPAQVYIKKFLATIPDYPFQQGSSLNAAGINYQTIKAAQILKRLENLSPPGN